MYYLYGGSAVNFSLQELFGGMFGNSGVGGAVSLVLGVLLALILARLRGGACSPGSSACRCCG